MSTPSTTQPAALTVPGGVPNSAGSATRPHAALAIGGLGLDGTDDSWLNLYLYSRAQSVMGGTSQIQRNLVAARILDLPTSAGVRPAHR
jgi:hypothetical protein